MISGSTGGSNTKACGYGCRVGLENNVPRGCGSSRSGIGVSSPCSCPWALSGICSAPPGEHLPTSPLKMALLDGLDEYPLAGAAADYVDRILKGAKSRVSPGSHHQGCGSPWLAVRVARGPSPTRLPPRPIRISGCGAGRRPDDADFRFLAASRTSGSAPAGRRANF